MPCGSGAFASTMACMDARKLSAEGGGGACVEMALLLMVLISSSTGKLIKLLAGMLPVLIEALAD